MNGTIAALLEEMANYLATGEGDGFRILEYRRVARLVREYPDSISELLREKGEDGLRQALGISSLLAESLAKIVRYGRDGMIESLASLGKGDQWLSLVPGIGSKLAKKIYQDLKIKTLSELAEALQTGQFDAMLQIGPKRRRALRNFLGGWGIAGTKGKGFRFP